MKDETPDFTVERLGHCTIRSPLTDVPFVRDDDYALYHANVARIRLAFAVEPMHQSCCFQNDVIEEAISMPRPATALLSALTNAP